MSHALEIKDLKFSYGSTPVLDIDEINIRTGEMVFLFGPSGSGKSTLLELAAGVLRSQQGQLRVCGHDLAELSDSALDSFRAENVGYIFQSFNLVPYLSVMENIQLPFLFNKADLDRKDLDNMIAELGLSGYINKKVSQLSVGQQQRVAVARALIKKPKLILADEPTSALDYNHREKFLKILFDLCRAHGTTVLFVSHDLGIEKLFDRSVSLIAHNRVQFENREPL